MTLDSLGDDWVVWSDETEKVILTYRPDVFDGSTFPAACLPTIYLTRGKRDRRPGNTRLGTEWHVTLFLEPDVDDGSTSYVDRASAIDGAVSLARSFTAGDVDYRELYQVSRTDYLDRLDELTGNE